MLTFILDTFDMNMYIVSFIQYRQLSCQFLRLVLPDQCCIYSAIWVYGKVNYMQHNILQLKITISYRCHLSRQSSVCNCKGLTKKYEYNLFFVSDNHLSLQFSRLLLATKQQIVEIHEANKQALMCLRNTEVGVFNYLLYLMIKLLSIYIIKL